LKSLLRRLLRFAHDRRYGLCYWPSPEDCKRALESVIGDSFTRPFSLEAPETGTWLSFIEVYLNLPPPLEWSDFLGKGLFAVSCTSVLCRALLSAEGLWVLLLVMLVLAVGLVQLVVAHCRLAWRARFSRRTGH
jgi:hypothetical protein